MSSNGTLKELFRAKKIALHHNGTAAELNEVMSYLIESKMHLSGSNRFYWMSGNDSYGCGDKTYLPTYPTSSFLAEMRSPISTKTTMNILTTNIATRVDKDQQKIIVEIAKAHRIDYTSMLERHDYGTIYWDGLELHAYTPKANHSEDNSKTIIPFDKFIGYMVGVGKPASVTLTLNNNYTATVTKTTITVGCQEFPISVLTDLNNALKSLI